MSKWSDKWNALPPETRLIGSVVESEMRINQLNMERDRLTKFYRQHLAEIDRHIRNLRNYITDASSWKQPDEGGRKGGE